MKVSSKAYCRPDSAKVNIEAKYLDLFFSFYNNNFLDLMLLKIKLWLVFEQSNYLVVLTKWFGSPSQMIR